ncbi:MAG: hypothetical protein N2322_07055, partial [Terrimicrobiaceae bacterium]|nr:hypothetical protein [Terrimicrobiaceae bacterium]
FQPAKTKPILCAGLLAVSAASLRAGEATEKEVLAAVQAWLDGLVKISQTAQQGGDAKAAAGAVLREAYDFEDGKVLFKPTLTHGEQTFRLTEEGALAYFVGGNPNFPDDTGFALKGWTGGSFEPAGVITEDDIGIFVGKVSLKNDKGETTTVDKTFAFKFREGMKPQIILHHSSLPFQPSRN